MKLLGGLQKDGPKPASAFTAAEIVVLDKLVGGYITLENGVYKEIPPQRPSPSPSRMREPGFERSDERRQHTISVSQAELH